MNPFFPPPAPFDVPTGMLLEAHANHHLQACEHNIGQGRQEKDPKKPPRKGTGGEVSRIYWSQHSDNHTCWSQRNECKSSLSTVCILCLNVQCLVAKLFKKFRVYNRLHVIEFGKE